MNTCPIQQATTKICRTLKNPATNVRPASTTHQKTHNKYPSNTVRSPTTTQQKTHNKNPSNTVSPATRDPNQTTIAFRDPTHFGGVAGSDGLRVKVAASHGVKDDDGGDDLVESFHPVIGDGDVLAEWRRRRIDLHPLVVVDLDPNLSEGFISFFGKVREREIQLTHIDFSF